MESKPVVQVSFLDFTLFKDSPEFFATYKFMNTKNHKIYSDKMSLYVVDLTQIENATEEDKLQGIDYWAKLFKATTWEEIKMLASNNIFLTEAAETVYQLSAEDRIRLQCEAREDFYNQQRYL
ncbi:MAG: PD-(D/E)XK nuclease family transposase [Lachnospiraceae bacterium]|nr:PD-(D/E)XK nuclease family transposase [Lachnospiraceae bacterium]